MVYAYGKQEIGRVTAMQLCLGIHQAGIDMFQWQHAQTTSGQCCRKPATADGTPLV